MAFTLKSAAKEDALALPQIASGSNEPDSHTLLKSKYGYDHAKVMGEVLQGWLQSPRTRVIKAIDDKTDEVLGWAAWGYRGYDNTQPAVNKVSGRAFEDTSGEKTQRTGIARLEDKTSDDFAHWMAILMPPGTKCMFIQSIVVAPAHQSRGVGTALIEWGTTQADRDGVFCWVHSSEAGWRAFQKAGFEEVGQLDIDLDEFAREEEQKYLGKNGSSQQDESHSDEQPDKKVSYGRYVFRYMKRPAQLVS